MKTPAQQINHHINTPAKSVLTLHRRPDGDSIGSNLALYHLLKAKGHDVTLFSKDPVPEFLDYLPGTDDVVICDPMSIPWGSFDLYWALDMGEFSMTGSTAPVPTSCTIINIDHHATNEGWGTINHVVSSDISCATVLYALFKELQQPVTKEMGVCLLTGLSTDSGFFAYIDSGKPLHIAAELIDDVGVNYQEIVFNIQRQMNIEDVVFLGNALSHISVDYEKKAAILAIPHTSWLQYGNNTDKTHLLIGYLQSINGTEFGVLIIEEKPKLFRIRLRSRNRNFDVAAMAKSMGGGGHKNAAGATLEGMSMEEALATILSLA